MNPDEIINAVAPAIGAGFILSLILGIIIFFIHVWITRWIFKVNKAIGLLEEISAKMDDLPKKPVEWSDIMPPKPKPTDAERYGPKF